MISRVSLYIQPRWKGRHHIIITVASTTGLNVTTTAVTVGWDDAVIWRFTILSLWCISCQYTVKKCFRCIAVFVVVRSSVARPIIFMGF